MSTLSRLRQQYTRVIRVVGATARLRHGAHLQGLTLADVAGDILTYCDFCLLCREDMRDAWINDSEHRTPRTTGNRVDTWERLYGHWYARRGSSGEPVAIMVRAQDRLGTYTVEPAPERGSEERLWQAVMKNTRALQIPQSLSDQFRRATEHYYREWQAAQAAALAQSKAAAQMADAGNGVRAAARPTPQDLPPVAPQEPLPPMPETNARIQFPPQNPAASTSRLIQQPDHSKVLQAVNSGKGIP